MADLCVYFRARRCVRWLWSGWWWSCCTHPGPVITWWFWLWPTLRASTRSITTGITCRIRWAHTSSPLISWLTRSESGINTLVSGSAGGSKLQSGRRWLRGVRRHSVRLGAAAHVSGGFLLPRAKTGPGTGEPDQIWWVFTRDVMISKSHHAIISPYEVHNAIFKNNWHEELSKMNEWMVSGLKKILVWL